MKILHFIMETSLRKNYSTKGASSKCWRKLTRGGGGVSQMLTIADEGGRGGPGTPDFGWRNMWTAPYSPDLVFWNKDSSTSSWARVKVVLSLRCLSISFLFLETNVENKRIIVYCLNNQQRVPHINGKTGVDSRAQGNIEEATWTGIFRWLSIKENVEPILQHCQIRT